MDVSLVMQAVSSLGFPIVCCGVLFLQNDKLRQTLDGLRTTLTENTTLLKIMNDEMKKED